MDREIARFIRLRSAVRATIPEKPGMFGAQELADSFDRLRDEVHSCLPEDLHGEFDRLFPKMDVGKIGQGHHERMMAISAAAATNLSKLAGWIDGHIEAEKELRAQT